MEELRGLLAVGVLPEILRRIFLARRTGSLHIASGVDRSDIEFADGYPFTEAVSWDELRANLLEAVSLHFEDAETRPRLVQMHYVKDELIPLEAA